MKRKRVRSPKVVVVTTTRYDRGEEVRSKLALRLAQAVRKAKYPLVVVDGSESEAFRKKLMRYGALVFRQRKGGLGSARRQACKEAEKIVGKEGVLYITEPEKYSLVREIPKITKPVVAGKADLVLVSRKSKDSYPSEQAHAESLVNLWVKYMTGTEFDFTFGPFAMGSKARPFFSDYKGEYGDLWAAQQIPKLRAINAGLKVLSVPVSYTHPQSQTKEEVGNMNFFYKRIKQLEDQIFSFAAESRKGKRGAAKKQ